MNQLLARVSNSLNFPICHSRKRSSETSSPVLQKSTSLLPIKPTSPRRSAAFGPEHVRKRLEEFIDENEEPSPSMREIARRLDHHPRTIFKHFPELCRTISARYSSHRKNSQKVTIELSCQEVRQVVFELYARGEHPTEARVSKLTSRPSFFRYQQVRMALREARQELGLET